MVNYKHVLERDWRLGKPVNASFLQIERQATEQDDERRDPHQNWVDEVDRSEATGAIIEPDSSYMTVKPQVV
ncbi:hypothetical protein Tco_1178882 [Tanacetum coccineum]